MNILIYGHPFYAKRLAKALKSEGFESFTSGENLDLTNLENVYGLFKRFRPQMVVNCSLETGGIGYLKSDPLGLFLRNSKAAINLFEVLSQVKVKKVVNILSSSSYYSKKSGKLTEDHWWEGEIDAAVLPTGLCSKLIWSLGHLWGNRTKSHSANLIVASVYGPEEYFDERRSYALGALVARIYSAKVKKKDKVVIWGSGKPVRDWLYVDDLIEAIVRSIKIETHGEPINIGTGEGITVRKLAVAIKKLLDYKGFLVFDRSKPEGVMRKVMDIERCRKIFGWEPKVDVSEGLKKTVDWYRKLNEHYE